MNVFRWLRTRKDLPRPLMAWLGLLVEGLTFLCVLGSCPWAVERMQGLGPVLSLFLMHLLASVLIGLAFPGWLSAQPTSNAARRDASTRQDVQVVSGRALRSASRTTPASDGMWIGIEGRLQLQHGLGPMMMGLSLCFPVLGALTAALVATFRRVKPVRHQELIQTYRDLVDTNLPLFEPPPDVRGVVAQRTWESMELRPFMEIVSSEKSDKEVVLSAIESTSVLESSSATRLLRYALGSGIPETRYYAAKALAKIEESLDQELEEALRALGSSPDDPEIMLRVADARLAYGELGQANDPLNRYHMLEAIRLYRSCLDRDIDPRRRDECQARLATACLKAGRAHDARDHYVALVDRGTRAPSIFQGLIEACYLEGEYDRLRHFLNIARKRCPDSDLIREIARVWLQHEEKS